MKTDFLISIVIPCYNEADNLIPLIDRIDYSLFNYQYEIIIVNDGSFDESQLQISYIAVDRPEIKYLNFSKNFGHQAALKAGIDYSLGDCIVTIDGDLQKPPELIPEMVVLWLKGNDIVTAICNNEGQKSFFKRLSSKWYYKILSWLSDNKIQAHGADFRLIDSKVGNIIKSLESKNLFLRGIFSWIGFRQTTVSYTEDIRKFGNTKYNLWKMIGLASNGVTSLSVKPLRFALCLGVFFAFLAFFYGSYAIGLFYFGVTVPGWASLIASIVFLSGIQLIVLGVLGEYLGKIYIQTKNDPLYIVESSNIDLDCFSELLRKNFNTSMERRYSIKK